MCMEDYANFKIMSSKALVILLVNCYFYYFIFPPITGFNQTCPVVKWLHMLENSDQIVTLANANSLIKVTHTVQKYKLVLRRF